MRFGVWHLLLAASALVMLGSVPIPHLDADTPLYARISLDVAKTGNWVTLHHPQGVVVDKPPLVFWLMAAAFRVLGVSDATLRLWQLPLALGVVVLTYAIARLAGCSRDEGLLAALMLATSVQFYYQATVPQQDVALTLFLTLAVYGMLQYVQHQRVSGAMAAAVAVALAVLTKGIAGLGLFAAVALVTLVIIRRSLPFSGARVATHVALASVLFAALALPWFVVGVLRQGEPFVQAFFTSGTLGVGRFFRPALSAPPPYLAAVFAYVPMLFVGMMPWSPVLVVAAGTLRGLFRQEAMGMKIVAAWGLAMFAALSLSSGDKVLRYLLPCLPPAAILASRAMTSLVPGSRRLAVAAWIALVPAVAALAAAFWVAWSGFPLERQVLIPIVAPVLIAMGLALIGFGVAGLLGRPRSAAVLAACCVLVGYALFERAMATHAGVIDPWPGIARAAASRVAESSRVVLYGRLENAAGFAYLHFDKPLSIIDGLPDLARVWRQDRVLVVVPAERLYELSRLDPAPVVVHQSPAGLLVIANWPAAAR
jgi:4-amino-4-deoxy-L-arabinose transferase-like glycosyltransferase